MTGHRYENDDTPEEGSGPVVLGLVAALGKKLGPVMRDAGVRPDAEARRINEWHWWDASNDAFVDRATYDSGSAVDVTPGWVMFEQQVQETDAVPVGLVVTARYSLVLLPDGELAYTESGGLTDPLCQELHNLNGYRELVRPDEPRSRAQYLDLYGTYEYMLGLAERYGVSAES